MIRDGVSPREQTCDICIVGSGPVGMALALELERLGRKVVVLESGGSRVNARLADASRADIADARRHAPMEMAVCRALGGTSWTWGGRCVAFDDVDFEARAYVPNSGWPIRHEDIQPWYLQAAEYLRCGNDTFFSAPRLLPEIGEGISVSSLERWSSEAQLALAHRDRMEQSQRITVCLNSTVVDLELGEPGRGGRRSGGTWSRGPGQDQGGRCDSCGRRHRDDPVVAGCSAAVAATLRRAQRAAGPVLHGSHLREDREYCFEPTGGHRRSGFRKRLRRALMSGGALR